MVRMPIAEPLPSTAVPAASHGLPLTPRLIADIAIEHGPPDVLGRFFLEADIAAAERGVQLAIVCYEEFARSYRQLAPDWPLLSIFRCDEWDAPETDFIHILGRNSAGEVVATQAARRFDWRATSLGEEARSLRLFFGRSVPAAGASCVITAPAAARITGCVAYSGGGWYRPDVRRQKLSAILPRISRALALTRWNTQFTVTFAERPLVEKKLPQQYGYSRIEDAVAITNVIGPSFEGALAWMPAAELIEDIAAFSRGSVAQAETVVDDRGGDQQPARILRR